MSEKIKCFFLGISALLVAIICIIFRRKVHNNQGSTGQNSERLNDCAERINEVTAGIDAVSGRIDTAERRIDTAQSAIDDALEVLAEIRRTKQD